jgi:hypothetical protein
MINVCESQKLPWTTVASLVSEVSNVSVTTVIPSGVSVTYRGSRVNSGLGVEPMCNAAGELGAARCSSLAAVDESFVDRRVPPP